MTGNDGLEAPTDPGREHQFPNGERSPHMETDALHGPGGFSHWAEPSLLVGGVSPGHSPVCTTLGLLESTCQVNACLFFFFFFDYTHSMQKFPGQGSNPCHSRDQSCCSDTRSLIHCATRERLSCLMSTLGYCVIFC